MSKIFFKVNNNKKTEETPPEVKTAPETVEETAAAADDAVQIALFPGDEETPIPENTDKTEAPKGEFDKDKLVKYFKSHPKKSVNTKVERFSPKLNKGLTANQVQTRFTQFLFNDTNKKYSRSYASIFIGNICTFFNLLCLFAAIALLLANTQGLSNYLVLVITTANIVIGIIQEIRSKLAIDKLSILANNTVKAIRDGETVEIPVQEIVLDDVIILELGSQVPADVILAEGSVEVNESLLTGESVAIKKEIGDLLYAGSFIASGSGKFRVEKVGKETYLEKLTSKAKKYKRPNSELMNSTKFIIKCVSLLIIPIAIGTFLTTLHNINHADEAFQKVIAGIFSQEVSYAIQRTCTVVIGMILNWDYLQASLQGDVYAMDMLLNNLPASTASSFFFSTLVSLFTVVLNGGYYVYCIGIRRGAEMPYATLLDGLSVAGKLIWCWLQITVKIFLWSMLFVIPGIIAAYRYRFAYYNLLSDDALSAGDAIRLSCRQTLGYKGELFMLDLSFIGWSLLSSLTMGLLNVWLTPYMTLCDLAYFEDAQRRLGASPYREL